MLNKSDFDAAKAAAVIRKHRSEVIKLLIVGNGEPRENRFGESAELFEQRVGEGLDLLIEHLKGDESFGHLYAGQRVVELSRFEASPTENLAVCRKSVIDDQCILRNFLRPILTQTDMLAFDSSYAAATAGISTETNRQLRTLFVGDCLMAEISSFLLGPLTAEGISFNPFPINPRNSGHLRKMLDRLDLQKYDAVFFSPYSHARTPEIEKLSRATSAFLARSKLDELIDSIIDQTKDILNCLASRFECPIHVHNCALVQRAGNLIKGMMVSAINRRSSQYVTDRLNRWTSDYISVYNATNYQHLFLIDESAIARKCGRTRAGKFLHTSAFQHPTILSKMLAEEYKLRIETIANLVGKKLVVCDLDNTIWDGVIGEGAVSHFLERQRSLLKLKDFGGVVLSIASKNDPNRVDFAGGVLGIGDFVAPQISWGMKTDAIRKIVKSLNLQTRHMVFLDDRSDERALVAEAFPDMVVLDASSDRTWRSLDHWSDLIYGSSDLDRTKLYQEQSKREIEFGEEIEAVSAETLRKLELKITIRTAAKGDLKRIAELINRTNQWNLCGSRTSFAQVKSWHLSSSARIFLASAADKFGDMGTVCVAVAVVGRTSVSIPIFVLSCRVFGYGVETAVLSEIARIYEVEASGKSLVGRYVANSQNLPCKNMYPDHGFELCNEGYVWKGGSMPFSKVSWAQIIVS